MKGILSIIILTALTVYSSLNAYPTSCDSSANTVEQNTDTTAAILEINKQNGWKLLGKAPECINCPPTKKEFYYKMDSDSTFGRFSRSFAELPNS